MRIRADSAGGHPDQPHVIRRRELRLDGGELRFEQFAMRGAAAVPVALIRMAVGDLLALTPDAERIGRRRLVADTLLTSGGFLTAAWSLARMGRRTQILLLVTALGGAPVAVSFAVAPADARALAEAIARDRARLGMEPLPDVATWGERQRDVPPPAPASVDAQEAQRHELEGGSSTRWRPQAGTRRSSTRRS